MPYADPERQRTFVREWAAARRAEYLRNRKCEKCRKNPATLFIAREGKTFRHRCWTWEIHRRNMELLNAWALCLPCQRKIRAERYAKSHPIIHGTERGYNRGCKCGKCLDAHARTNQGRRQRKRKTA